MHRHRKDEKNTLLPGVRLYRSLSNYVLWAVILTELRCALFVSRGPAALLFWITSEPTESGTINFLQPKNYGS